MTSVAASCRSSAGVRLPLCLALFVALGLGCATHRGDGSSNEGEVLAETAGTGVAAVLATALYAPAKIGYAAAGTIVGAGAYVLSGGNADLANAIIGPAMR